MKKSLKYRDLPLALKNNVNFTYGHIQKAQNPTLKHIIKRLKKFEELYRKEGADISADEKKDGINRLEKHIREVS